MAAKWQQWMPLYIDRFMGSGDVQMMEPPAFKGYVCLLLAAWQTEDCTLPADNEELARTSRLGHKLWAKFSAEVLRKFETVTVTVSGVETERLCNQVEYEIWLDAKRVFEARQGAASKTNTVRKPRRSTQNPGTVTDEFVERSAYTRTLTLTGTETETGGNAPPPPTPPYDFDADPEDSIPDGLSLVHYASFALETVGLAAPNALKMQTGDAIKALARLEDCSLPEATKRMLDRMRRAAGAGPVKWNFWMVDGWKQGEPVGVSTEGWEA